MPSSFKEPQPVTIGEGLPPVPGKLAKRIQSGQFIELAELLPDQLGAITALPDEDGSKASKSSPKQISSIIEWIQCFGIYTAVLSKSQPHRVTDLLGYQTLILQAYMEFHGDCWLRYDRAFRQKAATLTDKKWAIIDSTLWSLAFSGRGRSSADQCHGCSSSYQSYHERSLDKDPRKVTNPPSSQPRRPPPVCFQWNRDECHFRYCKYTHKCSFCVTNPRATDVAHKAVNCPYHPERYPLSLPQDKRYPRTTPK